MTALLLIPMLGMLALTVDVGYAFGQRRLAQNVADSAALGGTVVVSKRIQAPSEGWVKDGDVVNAINAIAGRSTGGFTLSSGLTGEYVRRETDGTINVVGAVGAGALCSDGSAGCIPINATGVRVTSTTTFNTFFAPVLNHTSLSTGARATALTVAATGVSFESPNVAPYALWTGEDGTGVMNDGSPAPDFLCRDDDGDPIVLRVGSTYYNAPPGSNREPGTGRAYDYSCTGGTDDPIQPGTIFTIRSTPNFETPNVSTGNPNWQVSASNFKGFIRADNGSDFAGIASELSDGGIAGGTEDAGMDIIDDCYEINCTLIMPIVSYGYLGGGGGGHPVLLVTGFAAVKIREHDFGAGPVTINSVNPADASTSYEWKAALVNSPVMCCPVEFDYEVVPGETSLLLARLYR